MSNKGDIVLGLGPHVLNDNRAIVSHLTKRGTLVVYYMEESLWCAKEVTEDSIYKVGEVEESYVDHIAKEMVECIAS